ncbi:lipoprotein 17-related variable surface protein, partial [Mycoplasmopsis pullorum]
KTLSGTVEQDPDGIYNRVVKVTEVVNANDKDGNLTIKYVIVSTNKNDPSDTYTSNEKEVEVPGFKTEEERLGELSSQVSYPGKEKTSPSEIDLNNITFTNNLEDANVELIPESITKDDLTNSVTGKYKITSTKEGAEDVFVEKEFTISNFQSEVERLNKLVNSKEVTKTVIYNDPSQEQRSIKASEFAAKENLFELISTNISTPESVVNKSKIEIDPDDIVIDDEDGTITFKYRLVSTKDEFANADKAVKTSTTEGTIVLSGFSELKKQVDITLIKNDLAKLTHLNPKQKADLKDSLINAPDYNQALKNFETYSSINDKMKKLNDLINHYDQLIADQSNVKYHKADNKTEFDRILNNAKELSQSTTDNGLDNNQFNLDNLIDDHTNKDSLDGAYQRLNGKEVDLIEKIKANDYLTNNEKTQLIAQVNKVAENNKTNNIEQEQKALDKIKQTFKANYDAKEVNDLYEKLNAKIIEYQKDVDNKELPKEIQDILDELINYGEDIENINKLIELVEQGKLLKSLHEQWNNSHVKNPDTEKAIQDLNAKINSVTELINLVESSNLNSKLDTSKNFVLNQNQYNINFAEAEVSYFDALKNVHKTKFIDATNKLEQLNQTKFVEFANSILNTSYFDTYKP